MEEPAAGSFSHFAYKYWGRFCRGFASGWNYWVPYVPVAMAGTDRRWQIYPVLVAGNPCTWASAAAFFIAINAINPTTVKVFGEMEFWFAIIKVVAVVADDFVRRLAAVQRQRRPARRRYRNLWDQGGFLPHGFYGLVMMMAIIMFSFGGLELVGITAAEADNPEQSIPKATNQGYLPYS
ncbi:amino acid permease [Klebsiella pneumoniae]|nr:amino acid permease [Klebsiella pneumoniae]